MNRNIRFIACILGFLITTYSIQGADLEQIRATSSVGKTRIVLDVTDSITPVKGDTAHNKQSLEVVLPDTVNHLKEGIRYSGSHGVLKGIELTEKKDGSLNLMIKVNQDVKSNVFTLTNPHRVVIDLFTDVTQRTHREIKSGLGYTRLQMPFDAGLVKSYILTAKASEPIRIGYAGQGGKAISKVSTPVTAAMGLLGAHTKQNGPAKLKEGVTITQEGQVKPRGMLRYHQQKGFSIQAQSPNLALRVQGEDIPLQAVNKDRSANSLVLYTPAYGASTRTNVYGQELVLTNGRISRFNTYDTPIRNGEFIISGHGTAADVLKQLPLGAPAQIVVRDTLANVRLENGVEYEGGTPILINGFYLGPKQSPRKSRTFLGTTVEGSLIGVAVEQDGIESIGVTVSEGAQLLRGLGVRNAIELEGQGAVDMIADQKILFTDSAKEKLYDHILVFI